MHLMNLDGLLPGEVGWVCACGAPDQHPLVKGAWNVAGDDCTVRLPVFRMRADQVADRFQLTVEPAAA